MTEEEKLHVLQVLDNFMSEEDKEFDKNDSQVWSNYSNTSSFCFSSAPERL